MGFRKSIDTFLSVFDFIFIKVTKNLFIIFNCTATTHYNIKYMLFHRIKNSVAVEDISYHALSVTVFKSFMHLYYFPFSCIL